jgi:hypothetical protein
MATAWSIAWCKEAEATTGKKDVAKRKQQGEEQRQVGRSSVVRASGCGGDNRE